MPSKGRTTRRSKMAAVNTVSSEQVKLEEKTEPFKDVPLDLDQEKGKKQRVPRRIIHFSDGVLEEYSTDEDEVDAPPKPVDTRKLGWFSWMWHYLGTAGCRTLAGADFLGEKLAWMFGITSPKYQFAIDEFKRRKEEEEEEKLRTEREETARGEREALKLSSLEGGGPAGDMEGPRGEASSPRSNVQAPVKAEDGGYDNPGMKF